MNVRRLVLTNVGRGGYRSLAVFLCAFLVAGLGFATGAVVLGAEERLQLVQHRLGADIVVVPDGSEARTESALVVAQATTGRISEADLARIAAVPGVSAASPQLAVATLTDDPCCAAPEVRVVGFDPETDFTVRPWLKGGLQALGAGEALVGSAVQPRGGPGRVHVAGADFAIAATLESTGTALDQTILVDLELARSLARSASAGVGGTTSASGYSAVMIRVAPDSSTREVAISVLQSVPGVTPVESGELYQSVRGQMAELIRSLVAALAVTLALSMVFVGLVFSMTVNGRRREIGVLRALGADRWQTFWAVLGEAILLAASGGILGAFLFALAAYLLRDAIAVALGVPFSPPSVITSLAMVAVGLAVGVVAIIVAALVPAARVSLQEPALAIRE